MFAQNPPQKDFWAPRRNPSVYLPESIMILYRNSSGLLRCARHGKACANNKVPNSVLRVLRVTISCPSLTESVEEVKESGVPVPGFCFIAVRSDGNTRRVYQYTTRKPLAVEIWDQLSKLTLSVAMKTVTASSVTHSSCSHWVIIYVSPILLLLDNRKQLIAKLFHNSCCLLETENLITTTYHPEENEQVERFNKTIVEELCHYIANHPKKSD